MMHRIHIVTVVIITSEAKHVPLPRRHKSSARLESSYTSAYCSEPSETKSFVTRYHPADARHHDVAAQTTRSLVGGGNPRAITLGVLTLRGRPAKFADYTRDESAFEPQTSTRAHVGPAQQQQQQQQEHYAFDRSKHIEKYRPRPLFTTMRHGQRVRTSAPADNTIYNTFEARTPSLEAQEVML
jgi:hypothetical protein